MSWPDPPAQPNQACVNRGNSFKVTFSGSAPDQSNTPQPSSHRQASWVDSQQFPRSLWTVEIRNTGQQAVTNVLLSIQGSINQIWEVVLVNDSLSRLPDWRLQVGGIPAGQSHVFGFIVNNNSTAAPVSLVSVQCGTAPSKPIKFGDVHSL
jgi:hypothetical protein